MNLTIYEARELICKKKLSCVELTKEIIDNIKLYNKELGAYINVCEDALKLATEADKKEQGGALWGIPIALKDNICTKDVVTTAGSRMLCDFVPTYDATVVKRLRDSGAIIIGKTNLDEFGMGAATENSAFGKTLNPINTSFVPGGSSGGSAAAVKANMALGALGSDTGGSVRQPAAFCGLYGLKPTYSLVSRFGLIAFASGLDTIGTLCKSVKDTAVMLGVIAGEDPYDATSAKISKKSYVENLSEDVRGLRIGIPREFFENADSDITKCIYDAVRVYEQMGAHVEECSLPSLEYAVSAYYIISSAEASSNLSRYDGVRFGRRAEEYKNLEDMYIKSRTEGFGDEVKRRIMLGTFVLSKGYQDLYYKKAKCAQQMIKKDFEQLFDKYDVLITPVSQSRVRKTGKTVRKTDEYKKDICTAVVNLASLPAMSVPCGRDSNNMPVGFQLIGKPFDEQTLLNAAYAFEVGGDKHEE